MTDDFIRERFGDCYRYAREFSSDRKTQNGAVLLSSDGQSMPAANSFPVHIQEYPDDSGKAKWIVHAEENAIIAAMEFGLKTHGATLFCVWAPCTRCARMIVRAGVTCLITHKSMMDRTYPKYVQEVRDGLAMLAYAGVRHLNWEGDVGGGVTNLMNGEVWNP